MAMLAEPRRRKRYNLCPRGKALYEDDTRFGTKMLEKMGWSKGRGLGANEDGSQEFVRVRFKNDAEGLGYENRDDQWTEHEEGFNGLLKELNGEGSSNAAEIDNASEEETPTMGFGFKQETPQEDSSKAKSLKENISGVSLEEKSKSSKARVHYKKFTRGKDLSQYSEKDLANIFGKKATEEKEAAKEPEVPVEEPIVPEVNPNFAGVQTVSTGLSVNDYFKLKMAAMKNKLNPKANDAVQPEDTVESQLEETEAPRKKKAKLSSQEESEKVPKEKKKKSKRAEETPEEEPQEFNAAELKKSKKSKKNAAESEGDQKTKKSKLTEDSLPEEETANIKLEDKKKKKSQRTEDSLPEPNSTEDTVMKKTKRAKKEATELSEDCLPQKNASELEDSKKKKSKPAEDSLQHENSSNSTEPNEKKLKKKSKITEEALPQKEKYANELEEKKTKKSKLTEENIPEEETENPSELKQKKKKSKRAHEDSTEESHTQQKKSKLAAEEKSNPEKNTIDLEKVKQNIYAKIEELQKAPKRKQIKKIELADLLKKVEELEKKASKTEEAAIAHKKKAKKNDDQAKKEENTVNELKNDEKNVEEKNTENKSEKNAKKKDKQNTNEKNDEMKAEKKKNNENKVEKNTEKKSTGKKSKSGKHKTPTNVSASGSEDSTVELLDTDTKYLTMQQLIELRDSYNICTISSFCAEKFHIFDLKAFKNSTLSRIPGYRMDGDKIELNIYQTKHDATRIMNLWEGKTSKYGSELKPAKKLTHKKRVQAIRRRQTFAIL